MFNDCFNLKIGWMVSMYIAVVPLGFDMAYPAKLQNLCVMAEQKFASAAPAPQKENPFRAFVT